MAETEVCLHCNLSKFQCDKTNEFYCSACDLVNKKVDTCSSCTAHLDANGATCLDCGHITFSCHDGTQRSYPCEIRTRREQFVRSVREKTIEMRLKKGDTELENIMGRQITKIDEEDQNEN